MVRITARALRKDMAKEACKVVCQKEVPGGMLEEKALAWRKEEKVIPKAEEGTEAREAPRMDALIVVETTMSGTAL